MIVHINLNCLWSLGVNPTFSISDLRPYLGEEDEVPSRMTSNQEGEDDEDITTSDTTTPIEVQGPITRLREKQLRHHVNSFLRSSTNDLKNRWLPNDLIVIRNQGVDHGGHVGHQEGAGDPRKHTQQGGGPSQFGVQGSDFESNLESRSTLPLIWVICICM
jgi:hypothetical protein